MNFDFVVVVFYDFVSDVYLLNLNQLDFVAYYYDDYYYFHVPSYVVGLHLHLLHLLLHHS